MKVKTSITLDAELLSRIDDALLENESRSAFFLDAAQQLARQRERTKRDLRDAHLLNVNADALNEEVLSDLALVSAAFQERGEEDP